METLTKSAQHKSKGYYSVMFSRKEIDTFVSAYTTAMLWSSSGTLPDGQDVESLEGFGLSDSAKESVESACLAFLLAYRCQILDAFRVSSSYTIELAGHDFWLTRAGHGVGFWDRGLGEVWKELTDAAHAFGDVCLYIGDGDLIYIC